MINSVASSDKFKLDDLVQDAVVFANTHGLVVALKDKAFINPELATIHAPLALLPVSFPRERFMQAKSVMKLFNLLVDRVALDEQYLEKTLAKAAQYDEFTARLLAVLTSTRIARSTTPQISLGINRSDYMLDVPSGGFLQVELNTIASSFGCLSSVTSDLHRYLCDKASLPFDPTRLPENNAIHGIPAALAAAVKAHGKKGLVMMIVQPGERNAYDQQWLQHQLWTVHRIKTVRKTLKDVFEQGQISANSDLIVDGSLISVSYFRAGYTPDDYPSEQEWQARTLIESSSAVRCPTVAYQLAGAKKIQQDLAQPSVLEKFMGDDSSSLRQVFAGLWSLDDLSGSDSSASEAVRAAIDRPEGFVLKPQREGGGNNLYGAELSTRLLSHNGLSAFILMQKILPPPQKSVLVRNGQYQEADTVSELGIYGTFLRHGGDILLNEEVGHLVRTKRTDSNEGGVAAGFAVLDSPYLTD
jgi:glutathione synthetase